MFEIKSIEKNQPFLIDSILYVTRRGEQTLYAPNYFKKQTDPKLPMDYTSGHWYAYGTQGANRQVRELQSLTYPFIYGDIVKVPLIPPARRWETNDTEVPYPSLRNNWLGVYTATGKGVPNYLFPMRDGRFYDFKVTEEGDLEFRYSADVILVKHLFVFVNGLAFLAKRSDNGKVVVPGAGKYVDNSINDRSIVFVDFKSVYLKDEVGSIGEENPRGCEAYLFSECSYSSKDMEFELPVEVDPTTQSILTVVDGRLLIPDQDYRVNGNVVSIRRDAVNAISEIDRQIALGNPSSDIVKVNRYEGVQFYINVNGEYVLVEDKYPLDHHLDFRREEPEALYVKDGSSYRVVVNSKDLPVSDREIYKQTNSFFLVVNRPNFQMVIHEPLDYDEPLLRTLEGSTRVQNDQVFFNKLARGLLYETQSRSVIEYFKEDHSTTFYTEDLRSSGIRVDTETRWDAAVLLLKKQAPIVLLSGCGNNFMTAQGRLLKKATDVTSGDIVLWPKYVMLDLVFRGREGVIAHEES